MLTFFIVSETWAYKCEAQYDELGIPHQQTSSTEEFYFCFGFHHGQDRAWEMDFLRRVSQGRNAEVLGYAHIKSDLMMRLLNLPAKARSLWENLPEENKKLFQVYSDGVNAGFKNGKKTREFLDLGYEPEKWEPVDTLSLFLTQSFDQTRKTFFTDYLEEKSKHTWGNRVADLFDHDGVPWDNTILKEGEYPVKREDPVTTWNVKGGKLKLWAHFPTLLGENSGSNNWVISAEKSKTGRAILANDPHLDLKTPMFWYWIHLKSPEGEMIGGSLPGVPVIVAGTNGKVAWGLTNAYFNTADAMILKDPSTELFETIRPVVWFKLGFLKLPFFFKSFERLKTGQPVLPLEMEKKEKVVLRWTGFSITSQDFIPMFDFMKVKNVEDMDQLLKLVGIPAWNFVFADTKGDIGYRMVGRSFRHGEKFPPGIPVVSIEEFQKEIFLGPDERPHVLKPKRDFVHSANNRHWPQDAAFYGGRSYSHSYRAFRIEELLKGKHDVEDFKRIQCDVQVVDARFFLPKLLKHISSPELAAWDLLAKETSKELSLYRRFMDKLMEEWKVDEYALYRLLDELNQNQQDQMRLIFDQVKKEVAGRSWGEMHKLRFPHLSGNDSWSFARGIASHGDTHSVNPGTSRWDDDLKAYQHFSGASMRMIIEMSDRPKIELVLPGLNRNYAEKTELNPWENWKNCQYSRVSF